jgi:hypothetical protein
MTNVPEWYVRRYWTQSITAEWRRGGDWKYLWDRTGRPVTFAATQTARIAQCKIHLKDCLDKSYDFCDLKSRRYEMAYGYCIACYKYIHGSGSDKFCARCYRQKLNGWRPI